MRFGSVKAMCAVVIVVLCTSPVRATSPAPGAPAALARIDQARALIGDIASGDPVASLRSALTAQGIQVGPVSLGAAATPPDLPPALAAPLAVLLDATHRAEQLRTAALARLTAVERASITGALVALPAKNEVDPAPRAGRVAMLTSDGWELTALARAAAGKLDRAAFARAATLIVAAIGATALPHQQGDTGSSCGASGDMVYETEDCSLMIGGTGPNGYGSAVDPALLVDLGGNDIYTNDTAAGLGAVRVVIDAAGDDTYATVETVSGILGSESLAGQGVGSAGVGVLADLGGNDSYLTSLAATASQPGPAAPAATVLAQGAGAFGAGVLLDAGGEDLYTAEASSSGSAAGVFAQGMGQAGVGALLDLGTDGDRYTLRSTSTLHETERSPMFGRFGIGAAEIDGQGAGVLGVGALLDTGGNDAYRAEARGGTALSVVQGASIIGGGVLIDAAGDDEMVALADGDTRLSLITTAPSFCYDAAVVVNIGSTRVLAQGAAEGPGLSLLADGTGDDIRTASAHGRAEAVTSATSSVDCASVGGNSASAEARIGPGTVEAQGEAVIGAGALVDLAGSDTNRMDASSDAHATAVATSPGADTETAIAAAAPSTIEGQASTDNGLAILADTDGNDVYTSSAAGSERETTSTTDVTRPGTTVQHIQAWGIGEVGAGWLLDIGGTDSYLSTPAASAAADDSCWSNGTRGRGRDTTLPSIPAGCP